MTTAKWTTQDSLVLIISLGVLLLPIIYIETSVLQATKGIFSYPQDDTFIHMAIAKNLAFHGVWGISPHEFASASSSPLETVLLAGAFKIAGAQLALPFILNLITAIILLVAIQLWLRQQEVSIIGQACILLATTIFTPLSVMVITGMEHTMHCLFTFLFIYTFAGWLGKQVRSGEKIGKLPWTIYLYAALLIATRYEGVFTVMIACLLLLYYRKLFLSLQLGFIGLLPILIFGIISVSKGSYFIPNSVLLKSGAPPLTFDGLVLFFTEDLFNNFTYTSFGINTAMVQRLLLLLLFFYLFFIDQIKQAKTYMSILVLVIGSLFFHIALAATRQYPRYEAYLVTSAIPVLGALIDRYGKEVFTKKMGAAAWGTALLVLLLALPLPYRTKEAFRVEEQACVNIYEQQYQMGRFLNRYYNTTPVAFNDIGAVSYLTEGKNLDMIGLGNIAVARARKEYYWGPDFLDSLARSEKVKIAIVYDKWFPPDLLRRWHKCGIWQIQNNVMCANDQVSFFALDSLEIPRLKEHLRQFQPSLPETVGVQYY
ncbi:hypothetical protein ACX0G9_26805 [Flavitalea flava]